MYVYIYIYIYTYIHTCIHTYIHIDIYIHIHVSTCTYIYMHIPIHIHIAHLLGQSVHRFIQASQVTSRRLSKSCRCLKTGHVVPPAKVQEPAIVGSRNVRSLSSTASRVVSLDTCTCTQKGPEMCMQRCAPVMFLDTRVRTCQHWWDTMGTLIDIFRKEPVRFDSFRFRTFRKVFGSVRFGSDNYFPRFDAVRPAFFGRVVARSDSVRFGSASGSGQIHN